MTLLDSYADQIAISEVRAARAPAPGDHAQETLRDVWLAYGIEDIFSSARFLSLKHANSRLWTVKDEVGRILRDGTSEPTAIATFRGIYLVNDARHRLKAAIAIELNSTTYDVKEYTPYDAPTDWDSTLLSFR